jgi:hypothetical protein
LVAQIKGFFTGFAVFGLTTGYWFGGLDWDLGATRFFYLGACAKQTKSAPETISLMFHLQVDVNPAAESTFCRLIGKFEGHPACEDRPLVYLCFAFCRPFGFMWRLGGNPTGAGGGTMFLGIFRLASSTQFIVSGEVISWHANGKESCQLVIASNRS